MEKGLSDREIHFEIHQELGECYAHVGKSEEAVSHFEKALTYDSQSEKPYIGLGVVALQKEESLKAKDYFWKAAQLNPKSDKALSGLGMALSTNGSREEGFKRFQEALDLNPENLSALMGLLESAYVLNQLSIAERYLKKYLEFHVADLKVLYCLAGVYFKQGKYREAQDGLDKILIFEPENQDALYLRKLMEKETLVG